MSKLEELIKEFCPNGVEYKRLSEVCEFNRGTSITSKDAQVGNIPVISGGQKPAFYHNVSNPSFLFCLYLETQSLVFTFPSLRGVLVVVKSFLGLLI